MGCYTRYNDNEIVVERIITKAIDSVKDENTVASQSASIATNLIWITLLILLMIGRLVILKMILLGILLLLFRTTLVFVELML